MEIKISLKDAVTLQKELLEKLKNNRNEIVNSSKKGRSKKELDAITLTQVELSQDLINVKDSIRSKNATLGVNKLIYSLSETKELIKTYYLLITNLNNKDESESIIKSYTDSINRLTEKVTKIEQKLEEINTNEEIEIDIISVVEQIKQKN